MPRIILCPVDGERLITETRTNAAGDTLQRYNCPGGDYSTEWRAVDLAPPPPGDENILLPENTEWGRDATEYTTGRLEANIRARLDDLLARVGAVGGGNVNLLDALTRVYTAVDDLELTTENIRVEAGTINLNTDTLEAALATLNTAVAGGSRQLYESVLARQSRNGRAFLASTGRLTSTIAGNVRLLILNPAGSGRRMFLHSVVANLSAGPAWSRMYINPTINLPTVVRSVNNVLVGGTPATGLLRADIDVTNALSGGTDTGAVLPAFTGRTEMPLPPFILDAGTSLGIHIPLTGAADVEVKAFWWEEDA